VGISFIHSCASHCVLYIKACERVLVQGWGLSVPKPHHATQARQHNNPPHRAPPTLKRGRSRSTPCRDHSRHMVKHATAAQTAGEEGTRERGRCTKGYKLKEHTNRNPTHGAATPRTVACYQARHHSTKSPVCLCCAETEAAANRSIHTDRHVATHGNGQMAGCTHHAQANDTTQTKRTTQPHKFLSSSRSPTNSTQPPFCPPTHHHKM